MIGSVLLFVGGVLYFIGAIGVLIEEFKVSIIWGLLGVFTQIANLIFAILYFKNCKRWLWFMLLGILLAIIGGSLGA